MSEANESVGDEDLLGVMTLTANFMLMNFDMGRDTNPEDAPELLPEQVEVLIIGRLQGFVLDIQQQERRPHLIGMDLPILMQKAMEQCQRWLNGDFR